MNYYLSVIAKHWWSVVLIDLKHNRPGSQQTSLESERNVYFSHLLKART